MVFTVYVIKDGADELDGCANPKSDLKEELNKLQTLNDDTNFANGQNYKKDVTGNIKMRNISRLLCEENGITQMGESDEIVRHKPIDGFLRHNGYDHKSNDKKASRSKNSVETHLNNFKDNLKNFDTHPTEIVESEQEFVEEVHIVDDKGNSEEPTKTQENSVTSDNVTSVDERCIEQSPQDSTGEKPAANGVTAGSGDWMTVSSGGPTEPPAVKLDAEPLIGSVRAYLAGHEPSAKPHARPGDLNNNARAAMSMPPDLLQRQPLLKPAPLSVPPAGQGEITTRRTYTGDFVLELPPDEPDHKYPKDIGKFILSFLFLSVCVCINMTSLSLVHERMPDRNTTPPLHDIVLDNVTAREWGLPVSEYIIIVVTTIAGAVVTFHKHRFIVARRLFFIIGLLYLYRSVTMFITVVPMSSTTYYCSPKSNDTSPLTIARRVIYLISGFGLSINGKHTYCGDYIYSGHTMVLVLSYLVVAEYSPRRLWPLQWALWAAALGGVALVLVAHGHYTLDVVVAYYVTTRLFWSYHSLLATPPHAAAYGYMLHREWWYPLFRYLERGSRGMVPRRYNWPLPSWVRGR